MSQICLLTLIATIREHKILVKIFEFTVMAKVATCQTFDVLASLCSLAGSVEPYLVAYLEDKFSRNKAQSHCHICFYIGDYGMQASVCSFIPSIHPTNQLYSCTLDTDI